MFTMKLLLRGERGVFRFIMLLSLAACLKAQVEVRDAIIQAGNDCTAQYNCSQVIDPVCGEVTLRNGDTQVKGYPNLCSLMHSRCILEKMDPSAKFIQIDDMFCGIQKNTTADYKSGRRVYDFSIVGAHQACNHTCPTHCTDSYEPACAEIHMPPGTPHAFRVMINHCHVDLYSCTAGLNVTLEPLNNCYLNPSRLMFMQQAAGLKSLGLLDQDQEFEEAMEKQQGNQRPPPERNGPRRNRNRQAKRHKYRRHNLQREDENPIQMLRGLIESAREQQIVSFSTVIEI